MQLLKLQGSGSIEARGSRLEVISVLRMVPDDFIGTVQCKTRISKPRSVAGFGKVSEDRSDKDTILVVACDCNLYLTSDAARCHKSSGQRYYRRVFLSNSRSGKLSGRWSRGIGGGHTAMS